MVKIERERERRGFDWKSMKGDESIAGWDTHDDK